MLSKLNIEKAVLAIAAAWFLATGAQLLRGPQVPDWGPARTFHRVGEVVRIDLDGIAPYPKGGDDPFAWRAEVGPVITPEVEGPVTGGRSAGSGNGGGGNDISQSGSPSGTGGRPGREETDDDKTKIVPPSSPPRFVGTLRVEESGTYTFVADGDEYVALAPGGGETGRYRLVERAATRIILEDASGRRISVPIPSRAQ